MPKNRLKWSEQEEMMATAYENIAFSFSQIEAYMKNHLRTVKNGMGIITDGDMDEILNQLAEMINKNLHNVSQKRVNIATGEILPKSYPPKNTGNNAGSEWVSSSTDNKNHQYTMKSENRNVVRLTESQLKQMITESVKNVLNEMQNDDFSIKCLNYLEQNEYSKESLSKVANLMFKNDQWTLYDGRHELLALATDQNGKLMYSFNQKAWQYVN